jgi:alanyl-tRNA synthetase
VQVPDGVSGADLRALATEVRGRIGDRPGVVALFTVDQDSGKVSFVVATTAAARAQGMAAGALVPVFASAVGGRGGGKPDLAQGGGTEPEGIPAALAALRAELARRDSA